MIGISSLAILDKKGKSLVMRNYRKENLSSFLDTFNQKLLENDSENVPPVIALGNFTFFHIRHENIRILGLAHGDSNAMMIFSFLEAFKMLLQECFVNLEADSVRENIILIYELMDEIMDNGYPQITDFKLLKKYITTTANVMKESKAKRKKQEVEIAQAMTSSIPWRTGVYKYSKNEAYLDVIEKINMVISASGQVLKSEVEGTLHMKCKLSGMPELVLGLNDKKFFDLNHDANSTTKKTVDIHDIKFHNCVRLARFENDRTISFIPPDGEFDLISYRMECPFKALFGLEINHENVSERRIHFHVKAKTNYKQRVSANFVEFLIPLPAEAQNIKPKTSHGTAKYQPDGNCLAWKITSLSGKKEINLEVKLEVPSLSTNTMAFKNQPVRVNFDIPYYTLSGLIVRYLKIKEQSNYHALSWVRYLAKNGEFIIRTNQNVA
jgi:AP-1 complex subunit mu